MPAERETAVRDIAVRAAGYAMPGVIVDGTDVIGCYLAARDAVARALAGEGPTFIEAKVTRLTGHSSDDQQTKYRSAEELAEQRGQDPLPRFRDELRAAGVLDEATEAGDRGRGRGGRRRRHRLRRGGRRTRIRRTLLRHVYAEPGDPTPGPPPAPATGDGRGPPDARPDLHRGDPRGPPRRDAPRRAR